MSFIVFSLPRSRSTWNSIFLSYGGRKIGHDIGIDCKTASDFLSRIGDGACETGAAFAWSMIRKAKPDVRFAVVSRDVMGVHESLQRFGVDVLSELQKRDDDLCDIIAQRGTFSIGYDALTTETGCKALFEFCLDEPFDRKWWLRFDPLNIQVDVRREMARVAANRNDLERLKADVRRSA